MVLINQLISDVLENKRRPKVYRIFIHWQQNDVRLKSHFTWYKLFTNISELIEHVQDVYYEIQLYKTVRLS